LITRSGTPLEPESLDEDILEQEIAERRALKVVEEHRWDSGDREHKPEKMYFLRAEAGDAIKGAYLFSYWPYFCIVFPQPGEITDYDVRILNQVPFKQWEGVCEFTRAILRETRDLP
jgi:hypothetical protein